MKINSVFILPLLLVALEGIIFWPMLQNDFIKWDEGIYLFDNPLVKDFSRANISSMLTSSEGFYKPLSFKNTK